jgi:hypothetical protein
MVTMRVPRSLELSRNRRTDMPLLRRLGNGPRDVGDYRHGAPTELFKPVQGPNRCAKRKEAFHKPSGFESCCGCFVNVGWWRLPSPSPQPSPLGRGRPEAGLGSGFSACAKQKERAFRVRTFLRLVSDTAAVRGSNCSGFLPPGSSGLRGLFKKTLSPSDGERVGGEGKQSCSGVY